MALADTKIARRRETTILISAYKVYSLVFSHEMAYQQWRVINRTVINANNLYILVVLL